MAEIGGELSRAGAKWGIQQNVRVNDCKE